MRLGYKKWTKRVKYGLRWAIEGTFSSLKRKFGEDLKGEKRNRFASGSYAKSLGVRRNG